MSISNYSLIADALHLVWCWKMRYFTQGPVQTDNNESVIVAGSTRPWSTFEAADLRWASICDCNILLSNILMYIYIRIHVYIYMSVSVTNGGYRSHWWFLIWLNTPYASLVKEHSRFSDPLCSLGIFKIVFHILVSQPLLMQQTKGNTRGLVFPLTSDG